MKPFSGDEAGFRGDTVSLFQYQPPDQSWHVRKSSQTVVVSYKYHLWFTQNSLPEIKSSLLKINNWWLTSRSFWQEGIIPKNSPLKRTTVFQKQTHWIHLPTIDFQRRSVHVSGRASSLQIVHCNRCTWISCNTASHVAHKPLACNSWQARGTPQCHVYPPRNKAPY